jgi:hypothetical protein
MSKVGDLIETIAGRIEGSRKKSAQLVGVLATLQREHHETACLLDAMLQDAREDRDDETIECRRYLFSRIRVGLLSHAQAEEQELYGRLRSDAMTHDRATQGIAEHLEIGHLLRRLEAMSPRDIGWLPTVATLQMKVEHHVAEEEGPTFALARRLLGESGLVQIDPIYVTARLRIESAFGNRPLRRIERHTTTTGG